MVEGDAGRAKRDGAAIAGLAGRPMPPMREIALGAGDPDRGIPVATRDAWVASGAVSTLSGLLAPGTRRSRSSSCVLSLGDRAPTRDQIFSPTSTYPSLMMLHQRHAERLDGDLTSAQLEQICEQPDPCQRSWRRCGGKLLLVHMPQCRNASASPPVHPRYLALSWPPWIEDRVRVGAGRLGYMRRLWEVSGRSAKHEP